MIGRWKLSLDSGLLLCAPSYHVAWYLVIRGLYPTINHDAEAQNKHYTTYWMLQFMWDCGYRIYADQWVKRLFEVNSKWLGKRGTNNTKTGMEIKRTLLQCSNTLETEGHRSGRQTLEMRVFHSMSSWVNDFIGCRWAVEHRTKVGLDEKNLWDAFIAVKFQYLYFHFIMILCSKALNLYNALW